MKIEVIKAPTAEKPFLVINKPKGLASAPLTQDDFDNALSQALELFPELRSVHGKKEIEYGLLHRLDTATDGLMVIAASQECYDFLIEEQREGRFIKYYQAECDINPDNGQQLGGFPPQPADLSLQGLAPNKSFTLSSYFRPFGQGRKEVRPVTAQSGKAALSKLGKEKLYTTQVTIKELNKKADTVIVECRITEGYRHQVRCHLAWAGLPVSGDLLYNSGIKKAENELKFSATKISFEYPRGDLNSYDRKDTWT